MSYVITSRPSVAAVYRMLPASLEDLIAKVGLSAEHVRNSVKLLLVAKKAHVSAWTTSVQPIISAGCKANVPRPTPEAVRFLQLDRRRSAYPDTRSEYQRQYREANKDKRAGYMAANRERMNAARNQRMALKRAIAMGNIVATDESPRTTWRPI